MFQAQIRKINLKVRKICKDFILMNYRSKHSEKVYREVGKEDVKPAVKGEVLVEKDSNITLIGINREEKRNSIDPATANQLSEAIFNFESDSTSPVAVLYGIGGSFCTGYDVDHLENEAKQGQFNFLLRHEGSIGPTRRHVRKPIVCGISGYCVGSGLELALLCDMRVMEDTAILGLFQRNLGVPLSDGGTIRLAAAVGYSRAVELILLGRKIQAAEALRIGLINRLVATGTALGQAVNLALSIAKYPLASLQHDRNSLYTNFYNSVNFRKAIQNESLFISKEMMDEMKEGLQRFKTNKIKDPKAHSLNIKEKSIPQWEQDEIKIEENYLKTNNSIKVSKE